MLPSLVSYCILPCYFSSQTLSHFPSYHRISSQQCSWFVPSLAYPSSPSFLVMLCETSLKNNSGSVWIDAPYRVCIDNTLFPPCSTSDLELDRAMMTPHRWIEIYFCTVHDVTIIKFKDYVVYGIYLQSDLPRPPSDFLTLGLRSIRSIYISWSTSRDIIRT